MQRTATTLPYTELEVADGNFDTSRAPIDRIVLHTMVGTWQGAAARFDNSASHVSAHYGVKLDGGLLHWLEEFNTAYHAGDYAMNQRSIGIEHEDGGDYNGIRPDILYESSAKLVADICKFYNIPIDRAHILKHSEVSDAPTGCPDALNIERIVVEAQAQMQGGGSNVDNTQKAVEFDRIITYLHSINLIPTDHSEDYPNDKLLNVIEALKLDRDNQAGRAGKFDQLVQGLGFSGDTNQVTVAQVLAKITDATAQKKLNEIKVIVNG